MNNLKGLPVSRLGYGCYGFSGVYGTKLKQEEMIKILQTAFDHGITFFDTASSYGTEEILGNAVKGFREKVVIGTKVGLNNKGVIDLSKEQITKSCEASLKKLGTDYIDIYQVHYHDPITPITETIDALESLKEKGKIRSYGVGHLPISKIGEYIRLGNITTVLAEISAVNLARYNELNQLQEECDFDILAFSVTGRGMLTGKIASTTKFNSKDIRCIDPLFYREKLLSGLRIADKFKEIGARYGMAASQVAINWTMQKDGITSALIGPTKKEHLIENIRALNFKLEEESLNEIDAFIKVEHLKLSNKIKEEIQEIVYDSQVKEFAEDFKDLIYVLEYTMENNIIETEEGMSLYKRILNANKDQSKPSLKGVKEEIKILFIQHE